MSAAFAAMTNHHFAFVGRGEKKRVVVVASSSSSPPPPSFFFEKRSAPTFTSGEEDRIDLS